MNEKKIQGSFFPPVKAISEHTVLDVNKIHFILASQPDHSIVITEIKSELARYREINNLKSFDSYYRKLAVYNEWDSEEVVFIKRLLQVALEEKLRKIITNNLFKKFVTSDEESFSRELYMSEDHIKCLQRNGMHIGSHGYDHYWLSALPFEKQKSEIIKSLDFLINIGCDKNYLTMCYPYGDFDESTITLLNTNNVKLGLTTKVDIANITKYNKYKLPRLDTNHIPMKCGAELNQWYNKA